MTCYFGGFFYTLKGAAYAAPFCYGVYTVRFWIHLPCFSI